MLLHCLAVDPQFVAEAILVVEAYEVGVLNRNRVGQALIWSATLQMGDGNLSPFHADSLPAGSLNRNMAPRGALGAAQSRPPWRSMIV